MDVSPGRRIAVTDAVAAPPSAPRRRGHGRTLFWLLALALLAVLGWRGWTAWQAHRSQSAADARDDAVQWRALDARIDALRRDQRAQAQRIAQADATNRVLRDEVLGIGQRAALLQDSVDKLADPARHGVQALRLDEAELLLALGAQRLQLAGDLDGARRAYALAAGVLDGIDDPAWLDLRQALVQERAALDALGADPKSIALARLDAFAATLAPPSALPGEADDRALPWWRRAFARIVEVRPSNRDVAVAPGDRAAGYAALQLELTLARSAGERRDADAWRSALSRADGWLARLWPPSPALQRQRAQLEALQSLPLQLALPTLGSTLQQLQSMRAAR
jgi:uroporphyrin-3 C-methyltransferase